MVEDSGICKTPPGSQLGERDSGVLNTALRGRGGTNDILDQFFQFLLCKILVASLGHWERSRNGLGKQNVEVDLTIQRGGVG